MNKMPFGGDYNPEQWDRETWQEDLRLFALAGIDTVTINVFNWAMLQKDELTYDFYALDETVKRVTEQGLQICMATATAAHPAWMARKYPDILRTEWNGMKRKFGGRHNSCPNSPTYQKYALRLVEQLVQRYRDQKNIIAWHVNNEYSGRCYCENCEKNFRLWLRRKYRTLDRLNHQWNTPFWGHTFYDWEDIVAPNQLSEEFGEGRTVFQGISLDYARFCSDSLLENFKAEYQIIRKYLKEAQITTNMMGLYKELDYQKWGKYMDFISYDNYPGNGESPAYIALRHDLMRGAKQGQPFWLMEQTPSVSNWLPNNSLKRPGVMRLWSYQAVAHGADSVLFFQMRRSPGACEKYHGAVIDHVGNEETRVFREVSDLGRELTVLGNRLIGSRLLKKTAVVFDWDNWWATEYSAGPNNRLRYTEEIFRFYEALHALHVPTDVIACEDDFSEYDLVIAPLLYMVKPDVADHVKQYVDGGGKFVTTFFSGYVNENDYVTTGGYPGELKELLGIWVEETDALPADRQNEFLFQGKKYPAGLLCDIIHTRGAEVLAEYGTDFYAGTPVITRNKYGAGEAYYVGTSSGEGFYKAFVTELLGAEELQKWDCLGGQAEQVEMTFRTTDREQFCFLLNHSPMPVKINSPASGTDLLTGKAFTKGKRVTLKEYDTVILELLEKDR